MIAYDKVTTHETFIQELRRVEIKKLNDNFSVSPQVWLADFAELARQGFKSIINNRPDDETADQPSSEAIREAASVAGLEYRHVPVIPGKLAPADVADFIAARSEIPGPVLGFCRTGKRAATLWALSESNGTNRELIVKACAGAGHDVSELKL